MAGHAVADRPVGESSAGPSVDGLAARWGAAAAWGFTALFVISNATYTVLALTGPGQWRGVEDYLQTWTVLEFVPQMLGLVALPLLGFTLAAAHRLTQPSRRVFSLAALACGLAFVTVVWVGYFVQVAWLLPTLRAGTATPGLELLVWRGTTSPGWAVNVAGWVLSGLMAGALAAALAGGRLETRARWLFAAYGTAQLLLVPWLALGLDILGVPIAVSWVVVLPLATGHLAVWMHRTAPAAASSPASLPEGPRRSEERGNTMTAVTGSPRPPLARRVTLPVLPYFVLTFAWTWSWWWAAAAMGRSIDQLPVVLLFLLGGLGPLAGAAWIVRRGEQAYRREFLRRVWDPRGIPTPWWPALVAVAAGPAVLGAAVAWGTGTAAAVPDYSMAAVVGVVAFALAAGLAEEPGWRGAASDAWQTRTRPVWTALGIGVLWAVWHLPLYFVEGSYQHGLGFGSVRFWLTNLALVQLGVLYLWLANGAGGSILIAVLGHAGFNAAGELVPRSTNGDVVALFILSAATLAVITATRGQLRFAPTNPPGTSASHTKRRPKEFSLFSSAERPGSVVRPPTDTPPWTDRRQPEPRDPVLTTCVAIAGGTDASASRPSRVPGHPMRTEARGPRRGRTPQGSNR